MPDDEKWVVKTARFNREKPQEAQVLDIIEYYEAERSVNFRELVVDRILRGEGVDPVVFGRQDSIIRRGITADEMRQLLSEMQPSSGITIEDVRKLLETFADEIIRNFKRRSSKANDRIDEDEEETDSQFARNFARGFLQRQQQGQGDGE